MASIITTGRNVSRIVDATTTLEGGGFLVHRPFPTQALSHVDPFLLLDQMGPVDYAPGEAVGAPDHPHRGFETVTYMLEGAFEHKDSQGHAGRLDPGDVQWMTAGEGIVHSEMPAEDLRITGGRVHGFQIWVNLRRSDKLIQPRYQEVLSSAIPVSDSADGLVHVKVIAGEALGAQAVIQTRTPISYLHYVIQPGGRIEQPLPQDHNAFAYVIDGAGLFGAESQPAGPGQLVLFGAGDEVALAVPADAKAPLSALLLSGKPLNEPIARYGPFVMNTMHEIRQAITDYNSGRMGTIPASLS